MAKLYDVSREDLVEYAGLYYGPETFVISAKKERVSDYYRKEEDAKKADDLSFFLDREPGTFFKASKHFPKTFKVLSKADGFYVRADRSDLVNVFMIISGRVVEISRLFKGRNYGDQDYKHLHNRQSSCLPKEIRDEFYGNFNGLSVLREPDFLLGRYYLLPIPQGHGSWHELSQLCKRHELKEKNVINQFEERFPHDEGYANFPFFLMSSFLSTYADDPDRPATRYEGDYFFVKHHIQDQEIYHIKDGDYENMRVLSGYCEAIDGYCEHILLRKEGRFNFYPFTAPFQW